MDTILIEEPTEEYPEGSECPVHKRVHNAHGWYVCVEVEPLVLEGLSDEDVEWLIDAAYHHPGGYGHVTDTVREALSKRRSKGAS